MSDGDDDPNELIVQFLDGLPTSARNGVYQQASFLLSFVLNEEEREQLILGDAAAMGEAKLKQLLSASGGLSLLGGIISTVALIDFVFERFLAAVPPPDLEREITDKFGSRDLARRHICDSAENGVSFAIRLSQVTHCTNFLLA